MIAFIIARVPRALFSAALLSVVVAVVATTFGQACAPTTLTAGAPLCTHPSALDWLGGALHLDLGRTTDNRLVTDALALAFGPTIILVAASLLITFVVGWAGGALLALASERRMIARPRTLRDAARCASGRGDPRARRAGLAAGPRRRPAEPRRSARLQPRRR